MLYRFTHEAVTIDPWEKRSIMTLRGVQSSPYDDLEVDVGAASHRTLHSLV